MSITLQELESLPLISGLSESEKNLLQKQLIVRVFKKNDVVVQKHNNPSVGLCFLLKGRLKVVDYSADGREIGFDHIEEGCHFGELSLIDGKPRSATVVATETSSVAILSEDDARKLIFNTPSVSEKMMRQLVNMVRISNEHIVMLGNQSASARIGLLLTKYAQNQDGQWQIANAPTQSEIATMANTTRETVSRAFNLLIEKGLIQKEGKRIVIISIDRLQRVSNGEEI